MNSPCPTRPRILLVEDDDGLRDIVSECLRAEGYRVDEAMDGLDALEACARRIPDAVILDLVMPRLDGWGFLARVRADARLHELPVLVATGAHVEDVKALGAVALLQKPFDMDILLRFVEGMFKRSTHATCVGSSSP